MEENVYRLARKKAAKKNSLLNSCDGAQEIVHIDRTKLLKIENDATVPNPQDVAVMVREYDAPELVNYYCTQQCPLGRGGALLIHHNLDRICVTLLSALHSLEKAEDALYKILEDGEVRMDEQQEFMELLKTLEKIAYSAESLKLWAECNGMK